MSVAKTCTPSPLSRAQIAEPMPLAAPVTSARLPASPLSGIGRAVDVNHRAGHVARVVRAERDDERGSFLHRTDPSHRDLRERTFGSLAGFADRNHFREAAACDDAWR